MPLVRVHQGIDLRGQGGSRQEGIYELREILNSDNKVSYKFSAVKGAQGLKDYLEEENFIEDSALWEPWGGQADMTVKLSFLPV